MEMGTVADASAFWVTWGQSIAVGKHEPGVPSALGRTTSRVGLCTAPDLTPFSCQWAPSAVQWRPQRERQWWARRLQQRPSTT